MPTLSAELRHRLEATVKQARRTAEAAAKVAIDRLTVANPEPGSHLNAEERQLRNRLRAHGRQLGDGRDATTGAQEITRLINECAYEHWHRMLFARFLAENNLLIHEKEGMPVTLAECDELAGDEGAPDGWTLAARYAARMLPQIFRPDDPVLHVGFAPEHKRALEKLVIELPVEVFTADDSLGWVYQFWQADRKDEVNKSGEKITGETLPAVTQLFTEHYMVLFLLHNTIGAWWAARQKSEGRNQKAEWDNCQTDEDCRKLVALPGYEFTYLRFIKDDIGGWKPAAGEFPGWPKALKDFKLLDPCCGSGHFLVAAFTLLVMMRMQDEMMSAKEACDAVLRENLHGLELDPRCTQIAAFALALTAWKFSSLPVPLSSAESTLAFGLQPSALPLGFRPLPPLNIACSGLGVNARKEDWLALGNDDTRLRSGLEQLYDLFQKAPELGSLIDPRRLPHGDLVTASFAEIQHLLTKALRSEKARTSDDLNEIGVAARGMASAANLLTLGYQLVLTNVPYLARGKHGDTLKEFCERTALDAKTDLATVFVERWLKSCTPGGVCALVTPQNWLFLSSYKNLRARLLRETTWQVVVRLGEHGFESSQAAGAFTALVVLSQCEPSALNTFIGIDVSEEPDPAGKASALRSGSLASVDQGTQNKNPDTRITFSAPTATALLSRYAESLHGQGCFDSPCFVFCFWERHAGMNGWVLQQSSPDGSALYSGCSNIFRWENGEGMLAKLMRDKEKDGYTTGKWRAGVRIWGRPGVVVSLMRTLQSTPYAGVSFDDNVAVISPFDISHLLPIWSFCGSEEFPKAVRSIDQKLNVTCNTLAKVPFDLERWQLVAAEKYRFGLPTPSSNDPTQWLFAGHPMNSTATLQVGMARLLGYRWPRQTGHTVSGAPPVPEDGLEQLVDDDGIVCVPSVRGEASAAERLRALLATAYGRAWDQAKLDALLSAVDYAGSNLEDWLRNGFFDQHSKLFHHRPFIWQIWDGRKDGFSVLVNYHKLDHKLLEKLTYTYLGEWIKKQQEALAKEESSADDRLVKARQLQEKLKIILDGEAPYDIFVRWKELALQPVGWNPDLNDGVRLNIRPFMEADVLRKRPNIKWGVDRGKNPSGSPWGEERDNDRHLTLAEKRKARGRG